MGTWAFFRLAEQGGGATVARVLLERLDPADPVIARDRARLADVRAARAAAAQEYFGEHAGHWDRIRMYDSLSEAIGEQALQESAATAARISEVITRVFGRDWTRKWRKEWDEEAG